MSRHAWPLLSPLLDRQKELLNLDNLTTAHHLSSRISACLHITIHSSVSCVSQRSPSPTMPGLLPGSGQAAPAPNSTIVEVSGNQCQMGEEDTSFTPTRYTLMAPFDNLMWPVQDGNGNTVYFPPNPERTHYRLRYQQGSTHLVLVLRRTVPNPSPGQGSSAGANSEGNGSRANTGNRHMNGNGYSNNGNGHSNGNGYGNHGYHGAQAGYRFTSSSALMVPAKLSKAATPPARKATPFAAAAVNARVKKATSSSRTSDTAASRPMKFTVADVTGPLAAVGFHGNKKSPTPSSAAQNIQLPAGTSTSRATPASGRDPNVLGVQSNGIRVTKPSKPSRTAKPLASRAVPATA